MEIRNIPTYGADPGARIDEARSKTGEAAKADAKQGASALSEVSDRVQLSGESQGMSKVRRVAMDQPDIRTDRVEHVRNMIESGTYVVEPDKIAAKMLEEF